jgi:NAD(P)-dependent dehydrogenase (short-subunit alcohol dehydrogenase family)
MKLALILDSRSKLRLSAIYQETELDIPTILGIECDVSLETSVQDAYKVVIDHFGQVDVAVACAGRREPI